MLPFWKFIGIFKMIFLVKLKYALRPLVYNFFFNKKRIWFCGERKSPHLCLKPKKQLGHGEQTGPSIYTWRKASGAKGYGRKVTWSSQVPKRRRATWENSSREKGKKLTLLVVRCMNDPCTVSRRCLEPRETSRTCKKTEDLHLHINEGILT